VINWLYFPRSDAAPPIAINVVEAFQSVANEIDSTINNLESNGVLDQVAPFLRHLGFSVEAGKRKLDKISVPVLFGLNGKVEKSFEADAFHEAEGFVLEVEAGRGVVNNQFLKDLFQACMMQDVRFLCIAVRNVYRGANDFEKVCRFMDTLYASGRLNLPLSGILVIGY
jgi:hypothetical protein